MTGNDHVQLFDDASAARFSHIYGWPHPWPPWERLARVIGRRTRVAALIRVPEGLDEIASFCEDGETPESLYEITLYRRVSYSELPPDMGPNVTRGAKYIKEEP